MSLDASGSIAGALVFSKWKGRQYVRQLVVPSNPKSAAQKGFRAMFKFLAQVWAGIGASPQATWDARAEQGIISAFNAFMGYNQARWRNFYMPSQEDPAAEASTTPSAPTLVVVPGKGQATVNITHGATAPDWGYTVHRHAGAGDAASEVNAVGVIEIDGSGDGQFTDLEVPAGVWYYRAVGFNTDGKKGISSAAQMTTVT